MPAENLDERTNAVRRFNRFYTREIGLLQIARYTIFPDRSAGPL